MVHSDRENHGWSGRPVRRSVGSRSAQPSVRRVAGAMLVPGMFAGMLAFAGPANATTTPQSGICNGVVNQLAFRGEVQANLLRAASRQNAALIQQLQTERAALVARETN